MSRLSSRYKVDKMSIKPEDVVLHPLVSGKAGSGVSKRVVIAHYRSMTIVIKETASQHSTTVLETSYNNVVYTMTRFVTYKDREMKKLVKNFSKGIISNTLKKEYL